MRLVPRPAIVHDRETVVGLNWGPVMLGSAYSLCPGTRQRRVSFWWANMAALFAGYRSLWPKFFATTSSGTPAITDKEAQV
jgi:hypothetical protein